jgi:1,4-dihydroxy-6-naphthoate synthase
LKSPEDALEFAKEWGRGIDDDTNKEFVGMYVNDRTIDYEDEGRASVRRFIVEGQELGLIQADFDVQDIDFIGAA